MRWLAEVWWHRDPSTAQELAELRAERERMRQAKSDAAGRLAATQRRWGAVNDRSSAVRARLEQNHIGQLIEDAIRPAPPRTQGGR
jgi:hypothetical protein